mmetsp:Transcript_58421/g.131619  ORF Transcript_58421/g.131619 Transcript_58421/m.131619 type:complete len:322 (+) Transcript_58421:270-1235(+)
MRQCARPALDRIDRAGPMLRDGTMCSGGGVPSVVLHGIPDARAVFLHGSVDGGRRIVGMVPHHLRSVLHVLPDARSMFLHCSVHGPCSIAGVVSQRAGAIPEVVHDSRCMVGDRTVRCRGQVARVLAKVLGVVVDALHGSTRGAMDMVCCVLQVTMDMVECTSVAGERGGDQQGSAEGGQKAKDAREQPEAAVGSWIREIFILSGPGPGSLAHVDVGRGAVVRPPALSNVGPLLLCNLASIAQAAAHPAATVVLVLHLPALLWIHAWARRAWPPGAPGAPGARKVHAGSLHLRVQLTVGPARATIEGRARVAAWVLAHHGC